MTVIYTPRKYTRKNASVPRDFANLDLWFDSTGSTSGSV